MKHRALSTFILAFSCALSGSITAIVLGVPLLPALISIIFGFLITHVGLFIFRNPY